MNLCIDLSTLKQGGGVQVAETFIKDLLNIDITSITKILIITKNENLKDISDDRFVVLNIENKISRNIFINTYIFNQIFKKYEIDIIFTIFGPTFYFTNIKHIIGFARPHIPYWDSPYIKNLNFFKKLRFFIFYTIVSILFNIQSDIIIVETEDVLNRLKNLSLFKYKKIFVVENTINQYFLKQHFTNTNNSSSLKILFVSSFYDHKNFNFFINLAYALEKTIHKSNFSITLTLNKNNFFVPNNIVKYFNFVGNIKLDNLPELYKNHNLVIHPSLLECFSACYIEAVYTNRMLIVPNLGFSKSILSNYAFYVNNMNVEDTINIILNKFPTYYKKINTNNFIKKYPNYFNSMTRTMKYLKIIETYK